MSTTTFVLKKGGKIDLIEVECNGVEQIVGMEVMDFLSVDEIVTDIINNRFKSEEDKLHIRSAKEEDLILMHHGFGTWIRNTYGLWMEQNPLTSNNCEPDSMQHPDNLSFDIIKKVRQKLKEMIMYKEAMSVIK